MNRYKKLKLSMGIILTVLIVWTIIGILPRSKSYIGTNPLIVENNTKPILIAHSGGNLEFPADTLEAMYHAYSIDPNCLLETDVNVTKDGEIILIHDTTLNRTTNLQGAVNDITYDELLSQEADFSYDYYNESHGKFHNENNVEVTPKDVAYPSGVTYRHETKFLVTKLEEVIKAFPNNLISVEIKQSGEIGLQSLTKVISIMDTLDEQYNTYGRISLASFNEEVIDKLSELKNSTHKNLMYSPATNGVIKIYVLTLLKLDIFYHDKISVLQIPMSSSGINLATSSFIKAAHKHNIAVHYWTINEEADMRKLIEIGADGIMSDRPTLLKQIIDEYYSD
jgi:glycerophosphoryl diester phosphodiesterase